MRNLKAAVFILLLAFTSLIVGGLMLLTFFRGGNFCRVFVIRPVFSFGLWLYGIRYRIYGLENRPKVPCIYISNHRSVVDFMLVGAMDFPRTRFFISATNKRYWPLKLFALAVPLFFIPTQKFPEERTRTFENAEKVLRETRDSVYLSPEGDRIPRHQVEPFNKGAFHLATNLKIPISPFYIHVPADVNQGRGFDVKQGTIDVHFLPFIDTRSWQLTDLLKNKDAIYKTMVEFEKKVTADEKPVSL